MSQLELLDDHNFEYADFAVENGHLYLLETDHVKFVEGSLSALSYPTDDEGEEETQFHLATVAETHADEQLTDNPLQHLGEA